MTAIPYHSMTLDELEREAYATDNKLALAMHALIEIEKEKAYEAGGEAAWDDGYAAGAGEA